MTSSISWLDFSPEEQKHNRELAGLFTQTEGREELGLGQVRDALSDGLFPGTSTLHTRAKYLLFIPWIFQQASERNGTLEDARRGEHQLISSFKKEHPRDSGVLGSQVGSRLQTLPSSVYWSALGAYNILTNPRINREEAIALQREAVRHDDDGAVIDNVRAWRAGIPEAPVGFPATVPGGMSLTREEAAWLQERFIDSAPDSLLAHFAVTRPESDSAAPWEDAGVHTIQNPDVRELLHHAHRYSRTMHGAQLLYNLMLSESYEAHGFEKHEGTVERYRAALHEWAQTFSEELKHTTWNIDDFFMHVLKIRNWSPVNTLVETFIRDWADLVHTTDLHSITTNPDARVLVQNQERRNKGKLARIDAPRRLETWGGGSGSGRYIYRWGFVKRILEDMHDGLETPEHVEEGYAAAS